MKGYWHVCTDGLEKGLIFKDKDDFIFGMNGVPVCALRHGVYVLAFCLMDNHVHFILAGDEFSCLNFILSYKRRLFSLADLDGVDVCVKKIGDKEYLLKAIAYVLRNPLTSRQRILPYLYRWSSGAVCFGGECSSRGSGELTVADVGVRRMRSVLRSNFILPGHYRLTSDGMVMPENYVRADIVERLFGSPVQMMYYVLRNDVVEMALAGGVLKKVRYDDSDLVSSVLSICKKQFHVASLENLCMEDKCRLAGILRKKYGIGVKQIARLTGLNPELVRKVLEGEGF